MYIKYLDIIKKVSHSAQSDICCVIRLATIKFVSELNECQGQSDMHTTNKDIWEKHESGSKLLWTSFFT
jgi:hypothetical protein